MFDIFSACFPQNLKAQSVKKTIEMFQNVANVLDTKINTEKNFFLRMH